MEKTCIGLKLSRINVRRLMNGLSVRPMIENWSPVDCYSAGPFDNARNPVTYAPFHFAFCQLKRLLGGKKYRFELTLSSDLVFKAS